MQTQKTREKFKLPGAPVIFGKVSAMVQSPKSFPMGSEEGERVASYVATEEYRANKLEVERVKAMAEVYAQDLRRRLGLT